MGKKRRYYLAGLAGAAAVVLLTVGLVSVLASDATEEDLNKVRVGMDRQQVLEIMGKPDRDQKVEDTDDLCRLYAYKKVGRYRLVNIWFNCEDKVEAIDKIS